MNTARALSPLARAALFCAAVALTGCNPGLYKQPAEDFRAASLSLRDIYFIEWDLSNKARIERGDLEDQVVLWNSKIRVKASELDRISSKMANRRKEDIHGDLRPLRDKAFAVLEVYATTLVSLASDAPTDAITSELTELGKDIQAVVENAGKLGKIGEEAAKLKKFTGPLQRYVAVINTVIDIVSSVVRERAIIETIGASNEAVLELLAVLKAEAEAAQRNTVRQLENSRALLDDFTKGPGFENASNELRADVLRRMAELDALRILLVEHDIAAAFDAARKAQGALVQKAMLKDPGDWTVRIREFRTQVAATKEAIERTRSGI